MFIRGRDISVLTVTGGTRASNGAITYGGSVLSLTGKTEGVGFGLDTLSAVINSIDDTIVHNEILMENQTCQVTEILTTTGDSGSGIALNDIWGTYAYVKVIMTVGGKTYTYKGLRGNYQTGVTSEGKNIGVMSLQSINDAGASPLIISNG
mgnify:CR=1 FL=1